jgi:hypothetical protein
VLIREGAVAQPTSVSASYVTQVSVLCMVERMTDPKVYLPGTWYACFLWSELERFEWSKGLFRYQNQ